MKRIHRWRGILRSATRPSIFRAARWRLVAWNVSVLIVILAILEVAVYGVFARNVYAQEDQLLQAQQQRILDALPSVIGGNPYLLFYGARVTHESTYRELVADSSGRVNISTDCLPSQFTAQTYPCPPASLQATSSEGLRQALRNGSDLRTSKFFGEPQRVLTFAVDGPDGRPQYAIQISRSALAEQNSLHDLWQLLVTGGLLGVIVAAIGSVFLAQRALVPIRQAFARQRQFTADASHELRTPLALIRANAEMLLRGTDRLPPDDSELVSEIIQETDHLNRMIGDLLTLARADAEKSGLHTKTVDLQGLVSDVHDDLQRIAESHGIDSRLSLDGPVTVSGDETRLRQLILILLDNALKYTDAGGRVDITLARIDSRASLTVEDSGIGIPPGDLPHIFERFYRVDRAREHASGGTGLGLAIARWIVEAHRGTIDVKSSLGNGTRFRVELPADKITGA